MNKSTVITSNIHSSSMSFEYVRNKRGSENAKHKINLLNRTKTWPLSKGDLDFTEQLPAGGEQVGQQLSDATTCCAICSGRRHKSARTAWANGGPLGWSATSLVPGWAIISPSGPSVSLLFWSPSEGEVQERVKEPAPSTWWSPY